MENKLEGRMLTEEELKLFEENNYGLDYCGRLQPLIDSNRLYLFELNKKQVEIDKLIQNYQDKDPLEASKYDAKLETVEIGLEQIKQYFEAERYTNAWKETLKTLRKLKE